MAKSLIQPGAVIDGFTVVECVHSGSMATLWSERAYRPAGDAAALGVGAELDDNTLTVHVLEAVDPAAAINHVDHIVIGAHQNSMLRTLLGSVSAKVAAEAPCSVTVVRPPQLAAAQGQEELNVKPDPAAS